MTTKTITTKSGKTIKVEFVRKVQDKIAYADGYNIKVGREIVEYTNIDLYDGSKHLAGGHSMTMLHATIDADLIDKGAVARVGNAYLTRENADLVAAALAELDAENPKSAEQLAIEQAKADADARWEADIPAMIAAEAFERRMDREDSDL